jgi:hypothetical protein
VGRDAFLFFLYNAHKDRGHGAVMLTVAAALGLCRVGEAGGGSRTVDCTGASPGATFGCGVVAASSEGTTAALMVVAAGSPTKTGCKGPGVGE